jgi:hypothetical protein
MADYHDEEFDPQGKPSRWHLFSLPAFLAIGWVIYEVSHQPGLAAMVMCLKFGYEDFRTALWLHRKDPWPTRGKALRMLYFAAGMWKAAVMGILMVIVILIAIPFVNAIQNAPAPGPQPNNDKALKDVIQNRELFIGAFGMTLFGQFVASLSTARALQIARNNRISLWLHGAVQFARHRNDYPPMYGFTNRLVWLNLTCFFFNWLLFMPIISILGTQAIRSMGFKNFPGGLLFFLLFFGYLRRAIIMARVHQQKKTMAEHPAECWCEPPAEVATSVKPAAEF